MTTSQPFYRNQEGKISVSSLFGFWIPFVPFFCLNLLTSYWYARDEEYFGAFLSIITGGCSIVMLIDAHGCFRHEYINTVLDLMWLANQIVSFGYWFQVELPKEWHWKHGFNLGLSATFHLVFILILDIHRNPDYYTLNLFNHLSYPTNASLKPTKLAFMIRAVRTIGVIGWYSSYSFGFVLDQRIPAALLCICSAGFMFLRKLEKEGFVGNLGEQFNTYFNRICSLNQWLVLLLFQFFLPTALQSLHLYTLGTSAATASCLTLLLRLRRHPEINDAKTSPSSQLPTEVPSNI